MNSASTFLAGGGEMGAMMRAHDWTTSPLGPPETWPTPLRTTVSLMLGSAFPMFVAWGDDLGFLYNDAYIDILGDKHPHALGRAFQDIWSEIWSDIDPLIQRAMAGEATYIEDLPLRMQRREFEEEGWFTFSYSPVREEDGTVGGMFCACTETTGRVQAQASLRASEAEARENAERVQLALEAGAILGTWFWDPITDRFTVDDGFARTFSLDATVRRGEVKLAHILEALHPDDRAGLSAAIDEAVGRGGAYVHQYRTRRADGHYHWLEAVGRVDLAPDGTPLGFPGVFIDIEGRRAVETERTRSADELRRLNETLEQRVAEQTAELMRAEEALRQSQKMEAVGQLTGGLAHDFNNLLAGISGSLDMIQTRMTQGRIGDIERYMVGAQGAAKRAAALTHRLLAFSRRQTLDPKPTDVNRLVAGMEDLIQRTVGPQIRVEAVAKAGLWPTLVDPNQLENALLNLCINARDAMPDGGKIMIETGNRWLDDRAARERDLPPGQYVSMCVSDTGSGMSKDVVERAFDPFFTTKPIGLGTGLGLSMIYGFARQSGGQVRIYSEVGQGTMVCVYIPRHLVDAAIEDDQPIELLVRGDNKRTVLVIDDEALVRMLVVDAVEDLGHATIEAGDGPQGLKVLRSDETIDLLITDVGLPNGMNGRQVADAARELRPT